jgi:hypothetical protein
MVLPLITAFLAPRSPYAITSKTRTAMFHLRVATLHSYGTRLPLDPVLWARKTRERNTSGRYYQFLMYAKPGSSLLYIRTPLVIGLALYELLRIPVPRTWVNKG